MVRSVRFVPWIALAVVGALFVMPRAAAAQEPEMPTLTVHGQGMVTVRPDVAIITMGAVAHRDTAQQAFNDSNALVGSLTQFLQSQGVAERDITTRQFSLSPEFSRPEGDATPRIVAWRGTNLISVKIRDFSTIGAVIDGAIEILGNDAQLSGIEFTVEDTDVVARQARDLAVADAREHAEQLAAAAGVRLIRIVSITETSAPPPTPVAADVASAAPVARAMAAVAPGERSIMVSVEIVYEIG